MRISDWSSDVCSSDLSFDLDVLDIVGVEAFKPIGRVPPDYRAVRVDPTRLRKLQHGRAAFHVLAVFHPYGGGRVFPLPGQRHCEGLGERESPLRPLRLRPTVLRPKQRAPSPTLEQVVV